MGTLRSLNNARLPKRQVLFTNGRCRLDYQFLVCLEYFNLISNPNSLYHSINFLSNSETTEYSVLDTLILLTAVPFKFLFSAEKLISKKQLRPFTVHQINSLYLSKNTHSEFQPLDICVETTEGEALSTFLPRQRRSFILSNFKHLPKSAERQHIAAPV